MAFKILRKNCCGLDIHKTWIFACIGITDSNGRTEYKQARFSSFSNGLRDLADWLAKYSCSDVCMESTGKYWIPVFNILDKTCWVTLAHPKYTKPQKGNKTDRKDAKWICDLYMCGMVKPSFIPPPDIRQLRDLMRYRMKLTNMLTGEKNRAQNCLTVSNLKLDDVFSDVFGKSSRSIIQYILEHPGEQFDVTPFIHRRCKHPVEEIQAAVDGVVSREQAAKLKECLLHIDQLNAHRERIETEILRLAAPYPYQLELIRTVPGFAAAPLTAVALISEIGVDKVIPVEEQKKHSWWRALKFHSMFARALAVVMALAVCLILLFYQYAGRFYQRNYENAVVEAGLSAMQITQNLLQLQAISLETQLAELMQSAESGHLMLLSEIGRDPADTKLALNLYNLKQRNDLIQEVWCYLFQSERIFTSDKEVLETDSGYRDLLNWYQRYGGPENGQFSGQLLCRGQELYWVQGYPEEKPLAVAFVRLVEEKLLRDIQILERQDGRKILLYWDGKPCVPACWSIRSGTHFRLWNGIRWPPAWRYVGRQTEMGIF